MSERKLQVKVKGAPKVVVVGPCASGKTTLVDRLRALGVDAWVSGQEHSAVRNLWRRLDPDVLIALELDLATLRSRRSPSWPQTIYDVQLERLREAFAGADVVINTAVLTEDEVVNKAVNVLERYRSN
jgi:nucleoside-triphosphatase THEP1